MEHIEKVKKDAVFDHIEAIREIALSNTNKESSGIFTALEVIEDTQEAISFYGYSAFPTMPGAYLYVYGLLQSLFVQQDAVNTLAKICGVKIEASNYPLLQNIRELRNDVTGHPTDRVKKDSTGKKRSSYIRLIRGSLEKDSFSYMVIFENGSQDIIDINIDEVIFAQHYFVEHMLGLIEVKVKKSGISNDTVEGR